MRDGRPKSVGRKCPNGFCLHRNDAESEKRKFTGIAKKATKDVFGSLCYVRGKARRPPLWAALPCSLRSSVRAKRRDALRQCAETKHRCGV